ncbi:hypothetical protein JCM18237_30040 [Halorubrum luteum]
MTGRSDGAPTDPESNREADRSRAEPAPTTDLGALVDACVTADATGLVAVGDRFDDDLRYLTRFTGPDREFALVVVPDGAIDADIGGADGRQSRGRAVLCAPTLFGAQARREFVERAREESGAFHDGVVREVRLEHADEPVGRRVVAAIEDLVGEPERGASDDERSGSSTDRTVAVPRSIPHDAAVYLERAGYTATSTTAISEARRVKTDAELHRLRRVQHAATVAMARAETVLADGDVRSTPDGDVRSTPDGDVRSTPDGDVRSTPDGDVRSTPDGDVRSTPDGDDATNADAPVLVHDDAPLTTERLRRVIDATLAGLGMRDAGNTVVGAGASAADLHYRGIDPIRPDETVLVDISPRGPHGYYGDLTRTFVVDGDGGWARRAYVAVEAARKAALAEIEPGATAGGVHREAAAELAAYGFDPNASEGAAGFTHGTGHGVGVSLHEAPSLTSDAALCAGHVVTVEPGVYDPNRGGVRLEDLVAVTEEGYELLATYPFGTTPTSE